MQWNAQSLNNKRFELIQYLANATHTPEIILIQETWFSQNSCIDIPGFICISNPRVGRNGGGCAIYLDRSFDYSIIETSLDEEIQKINVYRSNFALTIINVYNPNYHLHDTKFLDKVYNNSQKNILMAGDFNAHNPLWGSERLDHNGQLIEDFIEVKRNFPIIYAYILNTA